jgi:hypothetical protein
MGSNLQTLTTTWLLMRRALDKHDGQNEHGALQQLNIYLSSPSNSEIQDRNHSVLMFAQV